MANQDQSQSVLQEVKNKILKAKKEALKGKLQKLMQDHMDASAVVQGIEEQIAKELELSGENAEGIAAILAD